MTLNTIITNLHYEDIYGAMKTAAVTYFQRPIIILFGKGQNIHQNYEVFNNKKSI